jgi:alpha-methylacyl-CoA racemase
VTTTSGPLQGIRVLELGGIGPGPFAGMLLADLGADVIRLDRPGASRPLPGVDARADILLRGRPRLEVDLKSAAGRDLAISLARRADVLIDPYRPGVAERLGLGPEPICALNPRIVYGRITGWGQTGPWSQRAGHDINYVAMAGVLATVGRADSPPPPMLNLVGDFGGGGMLLAFGIATALVERAASGNGQVIDAAMVDGVSLQFASVLSFRQMGIWTERREDNALDGGAPYYDSYETADGRFIALGALEPQFYERLLEDLGLRPADWPQDDRDRWPMLKARLTEVFKTKSLEEWTAALAGSDACASPVLTVEEAALHPQNAARGVYQTVDGVLQPSPAPRLSRTPGGLRAAGSAQDAMRRWGVDP